MPLTSWQLATAAEKQAALGLLAVDLKGLIRRRSA